MESYICPVCGKSFADLVDLNECINVHIIANEEAAKATEEQIRKERIEDLMSENTELIDCIEANIRELNKLGKHISVKILFNDNEEKKACGNKCKCGEAKKTYKKKDVEKEVEEVDLDDVLKIAGKLFEELIGD